jgi:hypothetical protein
MLTGVSAAAVTIYALPFFWPVLIANSLMGVAGDVFGPAVASITLGVVGWAALAALFLAMPETAPGHEHGALLTGSSHKVAGG